MSLRNVSPILLPTFHRNFNTLKFFFFSHKNNFFSNFLRDYKVAFPTEWIWLQPDKKMMTLKREFQILFAPKIVCQHVGHLIPSNFWFVFFIWNYFVESKEKIVGAVVVVKTTFAILYWTFWVSEFMN
jgi:hypothetical protein